VAGNLAYARYLYQKQGTEPWFGCAGSETNAELDTPQNSASASSAIAELNLSASSTPTSATATNIAIALSATSTGLETGSAQLTSNLNFGMVNSQVIILQKLLNEEGFTVALLGPGSPGNETARFGDLTRQAVKNFQCAKKIICSGNEVTTGYGRAGPATRALLNSGDKS
jgi:peptidoglycan hydrolase-like protein with peptidoglycan-binding domain